MRATASNCCCCGSSRTHTVRPYSSSNFAPRFSRQLNFPIQHLPPPHHSLALLLRLQLPISNFKGHYLCGRRSVSSICGAIEGGKRASLSSSLLSPWDDKDKPYPVFPSGNIEYLDEQDVLTFLDPPKELIPFDPSSYNPAAYLWKKIGDIPEERRHRLLALLKPRLITRAWEIAGTRYEVPKLAKKSASNLLSNGDGVQSLEFWNCRKSGGSMPIAWINFFKKALFCCKDGKIYGRLIGGSILSRLSNSFCPLYFLVREVNEIMSTEQPCDLAYEFGDGHLNLHDYPQGFSKPAKHPWPFNDQVVIYIRHLGPGVLVGQAWQEGESLEQVPKKLCGEILMVKHYTALAENH